MNPRQVRRYLKQEWNDEIDRDIGALNKLRSNLLDFYRRIGQELEDRGWKICPVTYLHRINVSKEKPTKEEFFEVLQLIGEIFDDHTDYFPSADYEGNGLDSLCAYWSHPYRVSLSGRKPTGCKVEYKKVTKEVFELVKVDCPEFEEQT